MVKELVTEVMEALFSDYDPVATKKLLTENYIQHNPEVPSGRAAIIDLLPMLKESGISFRTYRIIAEDDMVVTHNSYSNAQVFGSRDIVTFDVFRIENGQIAEHWDNITSRTPDNPSGRSQTDGATEITDLDRTAANKALIADFLGSVWVGGQMDRIGEFMVNGNLAQHNSQIADGLDGLKSALKSMATQGITIKYSKVHRIVAEGNFVSTMSEGKLGNVATAFYDLFRIEDGKIAEHWDVISEIPVESANDNGKFQRLS